MIVSDKRSPSGHCMLLHFISAGARVEDGLFTYPLTEHFR